MDLYRNILFPFITQKLNDIDTQIASFNSFNQIELNISLKSCVFPNNNVPSNETFTLLQRIQEKTNVIRTSIHSSFTKSMILFIMHQINNLINKPGQYLPIHLYEKHLCYIPDSYANKMKSMFQDAGFDIDLSQNMIIVYRKKNMI